MTSLEPESEPEITQEEIQKYLDDPQLSPEDEATLERRKPALLLEIWAILNGELK